MRFAAASRSGVHGAGYGTLCVPQCARSDKARCRPCSTSFTRLRDSFVSVGPIYASFSVDEEVVMRALKALAEQNALGQVEAHSRRDDDCHQQRDSIPWSSAAHPKTAPLLVISERAIGSPNQSPSVTFGCSSGLRCRPWPVNNIGVRTYFSPRPHADDLGSYLNRAMSSLSPALQSTEARTTLHAHVAAIKALLEAESPIAWPP